MFDDFFLFGDNYFSTLFSTFAVFPSPPNALISISFFFPPNSAFEGWYRHRRKWAASIVDQFFLILRPKVLFLLLKASLVFVFVFVGKMLFCLVVLLLCLPLYLKGHFNYTVEVFFTVCLLLLLCKYTNNFSALFCQWILREKKGDVPKDSADFDDDNFRACEEHKKKTKKLPLLCANTLTSQVVFLAASIRMQDNFYYTI